MHNEEQRNLFLITVKLMKMKHTEHMDEMREHFRQMK